MSVKFDAGGRGHVSGPSDDATVFADLAFGGIVAVGMDTEFTVFLIKGGFVGDLGVIDEIAFDNLKVLGP